MILVISRDGYVETATEAGKSGYTRKNLSAERLAEALWTAYQGMDSLDASLAVRLFQQASKPPRTIPRLLSIDLPVEILLLIGNGIIYEGIATRPFLNEITVIREPRVIIDALDVNG